MANGGNTTGPASGRSVSQSSATPVAQLNLLAGVLAVAEPAVGLIAKRLLLVNGNSSASSASSSYTSLTLGGYTPLTDPTIKSSLTNSKNKTAPLILRNSHGKAVGLLNSSDLVAHPNDYTWIGQPIAYKNPVTNSIQYYNGYYTSKTRTPPYSKSVTNPINNNSSGGASGTGTNADSSKPVSTKPGNPLEYSWNLPPHRWSLPISIQDEMRADARNSTAKTYDAAKDMYRRGRLWHNFSAGDISVLGPDGKSQKVKASQSGKNYGFQFLWNPEQFSTSVSVQMDTTPTANDRFISGAGAFPATETISFTIHLDRTNDFAAIYAALGKYSPAAPMAGTTVSDRFIPNPTPQFTTFISENDPVLLSATEWYKTGFFSSAQGQKDIQKKIADLFMRGTIADIEYLYLAINGYGPGAKDNKGHDIAWVNGRGTATADIGFLQPTLLNIDIGPLSYRGYVTNLSVTHTAFTKSMIPIRSDVNISLNILATAGISGSSA